MLLGAGVVSAQTYPVKPIRIVTGAPAGGADVIERLIGQSISGEPGQPVIIDNCAGTTSGEIVARSNLDGYTLLVAGGFRALDKGSLVEATGLRER